MAGGKRGSPDEDDDNELMRLGAQAVKYADATSIHGLKYIGEPKRHWCERLGLFKICYACQPFFLSVSTFHLLKVLIEVIC